jgi:purine-binding chemotaxis protein CheW
MSTATETDPALSADIEDTLKGRYLTFRVEDEEYGIEILYVIEIVGVQDITKVPNMPHYVRGVINLRGQVIPVIDVRDRFGMPSRDYDARTCVIVVRIDDVMVGMVVDTVNEVREIPASSISEPPKVGGAQAQDFIKSMGRVGENVLILLDVMKLIGKEEMESLF